MEAAGTSRGVGASQVRSRGHSSSHLLHTEGEQGSRKTRWETKPVLASSGLAYSPGTRGEAACTPTCWKRSELATRLPCAVFPRARKRRGCHNSPSSHHPGHTCSTTTSLRHSTLVSGPLLYQSCLGATLTPTQGAAAQGSVRNNARDAPTVGACSPKLRCTAAGFV